MKLALLYLLVPGIAGLIAASFIKRRDKLVSAARTAEPLGDEYQI